MIDGGAFAAAGAKIAGGAVAPAAKSLGLKAYNNLRVTLPKCFDASIKASGERCRQIKNILYKDDPVDLLSQYVPVNFSNVSSTKSDSDLVSELCGGARLLISGGTGFGKTMFMKWATVSLIEQFSHHCLYPLFLELRYLKEVDSTQSMAETLFERTSTSQSKASFAQFEIGLANGMFVVVLDAVDEINPAYREDVVDRIREFMRKYPKCAVLVSSRPDES